MRGENRVANPVFYLWLVNTLYLSDQWSPKYRVDFSTGFRHNQGMEKISSKAKYENIVFLMLTLIAIGSRLVAHSWNFTAITATAFSFALLVPGSKTKAILLPVIAMLISDLFIGFHSTMIFVYVGLALALAPIFIFRKSLNSFFSKAFAVVAGSLIFFVISNFGVWFMENIYPTTFDGLIKCFVMGIPFYRGQFLADVFLTPIFYFAAAKYLAAQPNTVTSAVTGSNADQQRS